MSAFYAFEIDSPVAIDDLSVPEWGNVRVVCDGGYDAILSGPDYSYVDYPILQGPTCKAFRFRIQRCRIFGIGMLPAGFARFWDLNVAAIADGAMPLLSATGTWGEDLRRDLCDADDADGQFAVADAYLNRLLAETVAIPAIDSIVRIQAHLNDPDASEAEHLAESVGLSSAALARFCKKRFGFTPKMLMRRQRFLRMLEAMHDRPYREWPDFLDPHYTDQSHMIRDFHYFMGMSPTRYLALPRIVQQASAAHRTRVLGGALQGLA